MTNLLSIALKGVSAEFCQGFTSQEAYDKWINSNPNSGWNNFCSGYLGFEGYWELNDISHFTGLCLDLLEIEVRFNDNILFEGKYRLFVDHFFDEQGEPIFNLNESAVYGKYINSEERNQKLVTVLTNEHFSVNESMGINETFDIKNLGFIILCTDEMGYGIDYGDFIIGFNYKGAKCYFEYPGGSGEISTLDIK